MCHNAVLTLDEAYSIISRVANTNNRQKLLEIWTLASTFIPKYDQCPIQTLLTPEFAKDYLPLLKKIIGQSAGKKFIISHVGSPYQGITRAVNWLIWMPTRVGSRSAMTILQSYVDELEIQAAGGLVLKCTIATQTDLSGIDTIINLSSPTSPIPNLSPTSDVKRKLSVTNADNSLEVTMGVATNTTTNDGFDESDGEGELLILAQMMNLHQQAKSSPRSTPENTAAPAPAHISPPPADQSSSADQNGNKKPKRRLTKGSRRSLRSEGINLSAAGAWETGRTNQNENENPSIIDNDDNDDLDFDKINIEDEVFEDEEEPSWEQIPSDDSLPELDG